MQAYVSFPMTVNSAFVWDYFQLQIWHSAASPSLVLVCSRDITKHFEKADYQQNYLFKKYFPVGLNYCFTNQSVCN